MRKNEGKAKSAIRKPQREISNAGKTSSKGTAKKKMKEVVDHRIEDDGALDRLLLAQSDLSALIHQVSAQALRDVLISQDIFKKSNLDNGYEFAFSLSIVRTGEIDELVVLALKVKGPNEKGKKEIESFTNVLSDLQSSLKPWVPRLQKALSSPSIDADGQMQCSLARKTTHAVKEYPSNVYGSPDVPASPDETTLDSLISPSPLVSWRADCTVEGGRQLFLLTPLPPSKALSSKSKGLSASASGLPSFLTISTNANEDFLEGVGIKPTPHKKSDSVSVQKESSLDLRFATPHKSSDYVSIQKGSILDVGFPTPKFSKPSRSMLLMTPRLKMSPPKSCALLEPISESSQQGIEDLPKSTPYPFGRKICVEFQTFESTSNQAFNSLAPQISRSFGPQSAYKLDTRGNDVDASLDWITSPPKSCILMEPSNKKPSDVASISWQTEVSAAIIDQGDKFSPILREKDAQCVTTLNKKLCNQELCDTVTLSLVESTPMLKDSQSTLHTGKHPGENTLKRELWTRFEAATTYGLRLKPSILQETTQKGFLDLLEEVSCVETSSGPSNLR
ncbi:hypothetical protein RJ641_024092 [Dillenia turbinata]|uniref:Uncharacterized protein n=1 Tax=Dillenia turbinata TaxID=194707 RepID=A0AAN8YQZ9_9MAGN